MCRPYYNTLSAVLVLIPLVPALLRYVLQHNIKIKPANVPTLLLHKECRLYYHIEGADIIMISLLGVPTLL